jgi:hypothetical protein
MFEAIKQAIRNYIIRKLSEIVGNDIVTQGLTDADKQIIDETISSPNP